MHQLSSSISAVVVVWVTLGAALLGAGESGAVDDLVFRPAPEQARRYVYSNQQVVKTSANGNPPGEKSSSMTVAVDVEPVEWTGGSGRLKFTVRSIAFTTEQQGFKMSVDTSKEPTDEMAKAMTPAAQSLVGLAVTATIRRDGTVDRLEGAEKIATNPIGAKMLTPLLTPVGMQRQWWPIFSSRRPAIAGADRTWRSMDADPIIPGALITIHRTHTLRERAGDLATIDISAIGTFPETPDKAPAKATARKAATTGAVVWNAREGRLHSYNADQEGVFDIAIEGMMFTLEITEQIKLIPAE